MKIAETHGKVNPLERFSRAINHWVELLLFGLGFAMSAIVAAQVFSRYALNHSLFWSEELARYLLVWLTFFGSSAAYYRKAHPGIDVIYGRLPAPARKTASLVVHLVSMVLFGTMIVYGIKFAYFVRLQISPALYLPKWLIFSVIPVSGLILMVHSVTLLLGELKGLRRDR